MGQHSRLTMVGFFMELTYHEQSDRTRNENPRASGHLFPRPGDHSPKRLGTIGTRLDFDIILTDICPTLCLTPEHI